MKSLQPENCLIVNQLELKTTAKVTLEMLKLSKWKVQYSLCSMSCPL